MKMWMRALITGAVALAAALGLSDGGARAETKTLLWLRMDSEIEVRANGDLRVTETNVIQFTSGTFTFGYRDIDLSRMTGVADVQAFDGDQPLQVETSTDGGVYRIQYLFQPARDETRTFVIRYTARGAVRYYQDGDQVFWAGVYADRFGFPVQASKITVRLPAGVTATVVDAYGPESSVVGQGESIVAAEALEPIPSGMDFEIRVQVPPGLLGGRPADWQAGFDVQREYDENTRPAVNAIVLLVSLLLLFGGPALAAVLWYTRGRDPQVGLVADYLNEPPPGIAPGIAGVLVDERADLQDTIATLIDLARRGILVMEEQGSANAAGLVVSRDWKFSRGESFGAPLAPHEQKLVDALGLVKDESASLSQLRNRFYRQIGGLNNALYDQLVAGGFYQRRPDQVRGTYGTIASLLLVLTFIGGCLALLVLAAFSDFALLPGLGLAATTTAFYAVAGQMPVRTRQGAEARMRLEAFKRYLQNVEKYTDLKAATDQYEKYLPFAVAFGLDRTWTQKFAAVDAPAPVWYVPYGRPRPFGPRGMTPGASSAQPGTLPGLAGAGGGLGDVSGAARAPGGGLAGLDQALTGGLSSINAGLTSMFSSVANAFVSQPAPPPSSSGGGGGSGGGMRWGGSASSRGSRSWSSGGSSSRSSRSWSGGGRSSGGSSGRGRGGFG
jgi:hypothetical protein